jgi:hypothetical protein
VATGKPGALGFTVPIALTAPRVQGHGKTMLKFDGVKTLEQIRAQVDQSGGAVRLNSNLHDKKGHDHVLLEGGGARVLFNTFNGRFFGTTDKGVEFNSDSAEWDSEPWMQALLQFFYIEKT